MFNENKRRIKKETFINILYDKDLDFYFLLKSLSTDEKKYTSFIHLLNTLHSFKKMTQKFYEDYHQDTIMYNFLYRGLIEEFKNLNTDLSYKNFNVSFRTEVDEISKRRSANIYFYLSDNIYFHLTLRITHKKLTYINRLILDDFVKIKNLYRKVDVTLKTTHSLFFFRNILEHAKIFNQDLKEFEEKYLQKKVLKDLALNLNNKEKYFKSIEEYQQIQMIEIPF